MIKISELKVGDNLSVSNVWEGAKGSIKDLQYGDSIIITHAWSTGTNFVCASCIKYDHNNIPITVEELVNMFNVALDDEDSVGIPEENYPETSVTTPVLVTLEEIESMPNQEFTDIPSEQVDTVKSDGGSSSYYKFSIPVNRVRIEDGQVHMSVSEVIRYALNNDFDKGNIFKALVRLGLKEGTSVDYDINKCRWFLDELKAASNGDNHDV